MYSENQKASLHLETSLSSTEAKLTSLHLSNITCNQDMERIKSDNLHLMEKLQVAEKSIETLQSKVDGSEKSVQKLIEAKTKLEDRLEYNSSQMVYT